MYELGMTVIGLGALGIFSAVVGIGFMVFDAEHIAIVVLKIAFGSLGITLILAIIGFFITAFNAGWFSK